MSGGGGDNLLCVEIKINAHVHTHLTENVAPR